MTTDQKNELILKLLDHDINAQEFQLLQQLLLSDPETLALYQEHVVLDRLLVKDNAFSLPSLSDLESKTTGSKKTLRYSMLAAAACLVISLVVAWFIKSPPIPPGADLRFVENSSFTLSGNGSNDRLEVGKSLHVTHGAVELQLTRGVKAIIMAPAQLRLKDEQTLVLDRGKASFTVSPEGRGFTVITPKLKAVDLGTEFVVISDWSENDEVHVIKGRVEVSNRLTAKQILKQGQAVIVDKNNNILKRLYVAKHFQDNLPDKIELVFEDDFEDPTCLDTNIFSHGISGWEQTGTNRITSGVYNPSGDGNWYDRPELNDNSSSQGIAKGMKGRCLAFFIGSHTYGVKKSVGRLEKNSLYTLTLTLGVRADKREEVFGGYNIELASGNTILQSIKSSTPPCGHSDFVTISISWDSSQLPAGVEIGDMLTVRISNQNITRKPWSYLDFDNVRVTRMKRSQKK